MCHVLIIEDEPLVAMLIQDVLEQEGATSFAFAATEEEAVQAAVSQKPGLITSDVRLLEGNGPHAVEAILDAIGTVPVIFITASPEEYEPCRQPSRILAKPVDNLAITEAFRAIGPQL